VERNLAKVMIATSYLFRELASYWRTMLSKSLKNGGREVIED